jgi:hypothetical protein
MASLCRKSTVAVNFGPPSYVAMLQSLRISFFPRKNDEIVSVSQRTSSLKAAKVALFNDYMTFDLLQSIDTYRLAQEIVRNPGSLAAAKH